MGCYYEDSFVFSRVDTSRGKDEVEAVMDSRISHLGADTAAKDIDEQFIRVIAPLSLEARLQLAKGAFMPGTTEKAVLSVSTSSLGLNAPVSMLRFIDASIALLSARVGMFLRVTD